MKDNKDHIDESLILRHIIGDISPDEARKVELWKNANENNRKKYENLKKLYADFANVKLYDEIDLDEALQKTKSKIKQVSSKRNNLNVFNLYKIAAVFIILLAITYFTNHYFSKNEPDAIALTKIESKETKQEITLPDGTKVFMNKFSTIEYQNTFYKSDRNIRFSGEGYFEVAKDKSKPFIIETQNTKTQVVGTAFNLRALPGEKTESVIVTEGKVNFYGKTDANNQKVHLAKGDKGILDTKKSIVKKEKNTNENFLSWKTGVLTFKNVKLSDAIPQMAQFYNIDIQCNDSTLNNYILEAKYNNLSIEKLIEILRNTLNAEVSIKDDKSIIIKPFRE